MPTTASLRSVSNRKPRPRIERQGGKPGRTPAVRGRHPVIQAKLRIGAPDDRFEQEADRVADEVLCTPASPSRMTPTDGLAGDSPFLQRKCAACASGGGACPECAEEELQRKPAGEGLPVLTPDSEARVDALSGGGQPLPSGSKQFFESRFGENFGAVRIHLGGAAADAANAVRARAFTRGTDIVFGAGEFAPHTHSGKALIAHELTHVLQQRGTALAANNAMVQREPAPPASTEESALPRPEDKLKWAWKDLLVYPLVVDLWNDLFAQKLTDAEKKEFKLAGTEGGAFFSMFSALPHAGVATPEGDLGDFLKSWTEHVEELHKFAGSGDAYLDALSRIFGLHIEKYLGSDLFKKRLKSHSASVVSVVAIAQSILSTVQAVKKPGAEAGKFEPSQWEKQLGLVKGLMGIVLKEQFKAPDFFDVGPLKLKTHPAFAYSTSVGGAPPSGLTFEHGKGHGEGEGGDTLKTGLTLNLPKFGPLFQEGGPSAEEIGDLEKYRAWQGSVWFSYDRFRPTASMAEEGKLPHANLRAGALVGGAGVLGLVEAGTRYSGDDAATLSAWFLRGGFGYSGTKDSVIKRIGFDVTYTDWKETDVFAPGRETGTPTGGYAAQVTPFTRLEFGTRHKFGVGAALSFVAGSGEGLGVSGFRSDLSYTYVGDRSKDQLPVFKLDLSGSMHRLDWWNPHSPLLGGVEAKASVDRYFAGTKVMTGAEAIPESRATQIGEKEKVRVPTTVLFSAGVHF